MCFAPSLWSGRSVGKLRLCLFCITASVTGEGPVFICAPAVVVFALVGFHSTGILIFAVEKFGCCCVTAVLPFTPKVTYLGTVPPTHPPLVTLDPNKIERYFIPHPSILVGILTHMLFFSMRIFSSCTGSKSVMF